MTNPQNELYRLSEKIRNLHEFFVPGYYSGYSSEDAENPPLDIMDKIDFVFENIKSIENRVENIENQLALIIKLLGK